MDRIEVLRTSERGTPPFADGDHPISLALEARSCVSAYVLEVPDHPDGRGRVDRAPVGLVIQADVAAYDRRPEDLARLGHTLDALGELIITVRLLRAAEVEAVCDGYRLRPYAREVPVGFGDRGGPATPRIEVAVASPAVCSSGEAEVGALYAHHGGVRTRQDHGIRADLVVVLGEDRTPRAEVRMTEHLKQDGVVVLWLGELVQIQLRYVVEVAWTHHFALVDGGVGEVFGWDGTDHLPIVDDAQVAVIGDASDDRPDELVAFGEQQDLIDLLGLDDGEHPLLGLGDHDLRRLHPPLAQGHPVGLDLDADPTLRSHLRSGRGNTRGAEV